MTVNTAIFTCSICGEASAEICAYCTKDACSNHHCARCKRCSDCCECEVPLSAEEAGAAEAPTPPLPAEAPAIAGSPIADFLTPEEASVFAVPSERSPATDVFLPEDTGDDLEEDDLEAELESEPENPDPS